MSAENRKVERAPLEVEVTLESDHNFYSGITGNVSTGGVFVATYTPPPTGAEIELTLSLEGQSYKLRGLVCWVRESNRSTEFAPAGCGVRWIDLTQAATNAIKRFVDKRDTIFHDED